MKKIKKSKLLIFVISLVLILAMCQLVISHRLATEGEKIRFLEDEAKNKEQENLILNQQIADLANLKRIASQAFQSGLVKAEKVLSISSKVPVALK